MKVGIVGQGYVGTAVKTVFEKYYETNTFDLNGKCNCRDMEELVDNSDIIFQGWDYKDIEKANKEKKTAIFFGFQNCSPIEDDIKLVEKIHKLG